MFGFDDSFKALADPTRRAILKLLKDGPRNAGQIAEALVVPATALSFHLRTLKQADLISDQRRGQFIEYRLNASVVDELIAFAIEQFAPRRADATPALNDDAPGAADGEPAAAQRLKNENQETAR